MRGTIKPQGWGPEKWWYYLAAAGTSLAPAPKQAIRGKVSKVDGAITRSTLKWGTTLLSSENRSAPLLFDLAFLGDGLRQHHVLAMVTNPVSIYERWS
jgi:hypothetical protein